MLRMAAGGVHRLHHAGRGDDIELGLVGQIEHILPLEAKSGYAGVILTCKIEQCSIAVNARYDAIGHDQPGDSGGDGSSAASDVEDMHA